MDRVNFLLTDGRNVSTSYNFLAATDWTTPQVVIAGRAQGADKATYRICIQKITLSVTTDNAAQQFWATNNGTPVEIARSKTSPGLGPITWDFGTEGWKLPAGESLMHDMSAAGMAGAVAIQAYIEKIPNV